jgi:uncharacterized protein
VRLKRDPSPDQSAGTPSERRCVLTGRHGPRAALLRLALAPDGRIVPDVLAKLPGRGAWVVYDQALLSTALKTGKLRAALARAFKCTPATLTLEADLPRHIALLLQKRLLERLGLELKAGLLISGADKITQALRAGQCLLVLHASDASSDGKRKLSFIDVPAITLPLERDALSLGLGRDNIVHLGLIDPKAARRVVVQVEHWLAYLGQGADEADSAEAVCG